MAKGYRVWERSPGDWAYETDEGYYGCGFGSRAEAERIAKLVIETRAKEMIKADGEKPV